MPEKQELAKPAPALPAVAEEAALAIKAESELNWFMQEEKFKHLWRVAKLFASSSIVPDRFQSKYERQGNEIVCVEDKTSDCAIVIAMAWRHRADPMAFLNGVYVVHGRPGMEAKLAVALVNQAGIFRGPIRYEFAGEGSSRTCRAYATFAETDEVVDMTVSMEMAVKEGWTKNAKWSSMPDVMLRYRSAMFLIRAYAPEVLFGMMTKEELDEMHARPIKVEVTADAVRDKIAGARKQLPGTSVAATLEAGAKVRDTVDDVIEVTGRTNSAADEPEPEAPAEPAKPRIDEGGEQTLTLVGDVVNRSTGEVLEERADPDDEGTDPITGEEVPAAAPPADTCKACGGSGESSKGGACVACSGTGTAKKAAAKPRGRKKADAKPKGTGTSDKALREERSKLVATYIDVCESYNVEMGKVTTMTNATIEKKIAEITGKGK